MLTKGKKKRNSNDEGRQVWSRKKGGGRGSTGENTIIKARGGGKGLRPLANQ